MATIVLSTYAFITVIGMGFWRILATIVKEFST
jgi:hypothetical protein